MEVLVVIALLCGVFIFRWSVKPKPRHRAPDVRPRPKRARPSGYVNKPPSGYVNKRPIARSNQCQNQNQNQNHPPFPKSMQITGKAYVIDGDTIIVQKIRIRLAGVDAPELNMPWGQKSKWAMVNICKGQTITVKLDGQRSYNRLVGTCFLSDGRDIGAELIKQGLALDLPHFSGGKYRHLEPEGAQKRLCYGQFGHVSIRLRTQSG